MNAPEKIRLTEFSHGGGCGCKIAPAILSEILSAAPIRGLPKDLLVGTETSDDAAVFRLNDQHAFVTTEPAGALRPGDLLRLGISHPCGAFDRWRTLLEVDPDYTVTRAIRTFF